MENLISRYRNVTILAALLFGQVLGLAMQVKRASENESTRLIRIWAVDAVTPFEKGIVHLQMGAGYLWRNYFYLRGVRQENRELKQKIEQLEIERARLSEDAEQAHRLQALLGFKEQFIAQTVAAQVIGSSGSEQSKSIYIDRGAGDGLKPDMAVITPDGIVGKVLRVQNHVASVLLIDDQSSGVGAVLEKSRLQGVLRGTATGEVTLEKVMADEAVQPGDKVLTSGGDQIFPKGLPVGTVTKVSPGAELFLNIRVKPVADLSRLEEVLVITQQQEREPVVAAGVRVRAADILAQRLPSVPEKPATQVAKAPNAAAATPGVAGKTPAKPAAPGAVTGPNPGAGSPPKSAAASPKPSVVPKPPAPVTTAPAGNGNTAEPKIPPVSGPVVVEPGPTQPAAPQDQPQ